MQDPMSLLKSIQKAEGLGAEIREAATSSSGTAESKSQPPSKQAARSSTSSQKPKSKALITEVVAVSVIQDMKHLVHCYPWFMCGLNSKLVKCYDRRSQHFK